ncbi:Protein NAR1 [Vitis vinifera]|uniref:Protein NAR1 n=1 Tax=Vitis vinifera TaxID=29760 RepID=A0A438DDQ6_VITVI|nr:Protein NAR1 [Vitis vinifera]
MVSKSIPDFDVEVYLTLYEVFDSVISPTTGWSIDAVLSIYNFTPHPVLPHVPVKPPLPPPRIKPPEMSEKFSATLRIGDLNDFIAPSQGCVVSLKGLKAAPAKPEKAEVIDVGSVKLWSFEANTEPVKISLKDCLACSGCITSAETVMLEKQSMDEFLFNINKGKQSLSPFLPSQGLPLLFILASLHSSRDLSLIESCNAFISRYKQHHSTEDEKCKTSLPMLSSACPGWICYAEKTLGSYILPYISSVKSPQQTIGVTIKNYLCQKMGFRSLRLQGMTLCFEVDSPGGVHENTGLRITEVDSVLTSGEVLELIQLKSVDFKNLEESPLDRLLTNVNEEGHLYGVQGSSGGYADTIFRYAAKTLFGRELKGPLDFKTPYKECSRHSIKTVSRRTAVVSWVLPALVRETLLGWHGPFEDKKHRKIEGQTVLKFALCYGFRNLQNIVRKIKIGKCDYHFLEVMACPSGCLNGGGQIKPKAGQSAKDLIQSLEAIYMENVVVADPFKNPIVKGLYDEWLEQPGSEKAKRLIHTEYHPVHNASYVEMPIIDMGARVESSNFEYR